MTENKTEKKKNKRVGPIIFRIVLIIIAGLTVGIGVFSWNASGLVGNQLPMPFGFGVSVVMSPSMEPVLHTNDLVFVSEQDSYDVGDIVVYQEGNMLVIHRITNIDGDKVITKGDANNVADDPISMEDIKAKYSFRIPFIGVIFKYLKTVPGTLLVLVLAIFLLYRSRQKEREKDREELEDIVEEIKRLRSLQNGSGSDEEKTEKSEAVENTAEEIKEQSSDSVQEAETEAKHSEPAEEAETEEEPSEPAEEAESEAEDKTSHETAELSSETTSAVRDEDTDLAEVKAILEDMSE